MTQRDPDGKGAPPSGEQPTVVAPGAAPEGSLGDEVPTRQFDRGARPGSSVPSTGQGHRPPSQVDNFQVQRLLGAGGMGEVYLARDMLLGRKVALKVLHPRALGSPDAIERFQFEARTTARFSHPHIVTIYAVGQHGDHPYVALEYLEGETLRQRMADEELGVKESIRIGMAIADALREAHRHQILHRDLKPENVMIPRDGRVRVLDLGLAKVFSAPEGGAEPVDPTDVDPDDGPLTRAGRAGGTPSYMAPEQWGGGPVSPATDVWALGVVLYEMLCGHRPYDMPDVRALCFQVSSDAPAPPLDPLAPVPDDLTALIARCLAKDPEERPGADEVHGALHDLLYPSPQSRDGETSPFRGLLPFHERHSQRFFGRDAEIGAFLERLREIPILPVVGPSGAGKSSFVRAGIIPRLREQGPWIVITLRPGRDPFRGLASRLSSGAVVATADDTWLGSSWDASSSTSSGVREVLPGLGAEDLEPSLRQNPGRLGVLLRELAEAERARVLLFIDQAEELFTQTEEPDLAREFLAALAAAADDPDGPVRAILALRDDFIVRLAGVPAGREITGQITVLRSPGEAQLREIVTRPLQDAGYRFEDEELPAEMVAAVRGEPACLPLLQFACTQLWERRDRQRRRLPRAAYLEIGGVEGALASHADGLLESLDRRQSEQARTLLLRLVTPERTRRTLTRGQLLDGLDAAEVLDRLVSDRILLTRRARSGADDAEVELAHESMIRDWGVLARWLDESREELAFLDEVGKAAALWEARGRPDAEVWVGDALADARRRSEHLDELPGPVRAFLAASARRQEARTRRNRRLVATAIGALLVVAIALGVLYREARWQRSVAEEERVSAVDSQARLLADGADAALARGDLLEARARLRASLEIRSSTHARALWQRQDREPLRWRSSLRARSGSAQVSWSPRGDWIALATTIEQFYLVDPRSGEASPIDPDVEVEDDVMSVAFSADGGLLALGMRSGELMVRDVDREADRHAWPTGDSPLVSLAFSPDGGTLAALGQDGTLHLGSPAADRPDRSFASGTRGPSMAGDVLAFSPDGALLAVGGTDGTVRLWTVDEEGEPRRFTGHDGPVDTLAFSPDGTQLATGASDVTVRSWDVASGEERTRIRCQPDRIRGMAVQYRDGWVAACGSDRRSVSLWDVDRGELLTELGDDLYNVDGMAFSPDGDRLTVADWTSLRLWSTRVAGARREGVGHGRDVRALVHTPDGEQVISAGEDGAIWVWDAASGEAIATLRGPQRSLYSLDISPDGRRLVTGGTDRVVCVWDLGTRRLLHTMEGHTANVWGVAFGPDGRLVASGAMDRSVRLWDALTGELRATMEGPDKGILSIDVRADGRQVAAGSADGTVWIYSVAGAALERRLEGHGYDVWGIDYGDDGRTLFTGGWDQTLRRWDPTSGRNPETFRPTTCALAPEGAPNFPAVISLAGGRRLAAVCEKFKAAIWSLDSGEELAAFDARWGLDYALSASPDGVYLASGDGPMVRRWTAADGYPSWRAPVLLPDAPHLFTHRGWQDLSPDGDSGPPAPSAWRRAIEESAFAGDASADRLCLLTHDDRLEIWDRAEDRLLDEAPAHRGSKVFATATGCITERRSEVALHLPGRSEPLTLDGYNGGHVDPDAGEVHVVGDAVMIRYDLQGKRLGDVPAVGDFRVSARLGDAIAVIDPAKDIKLWPIEGGELIRTIRLEDAPDLAPIHALAGPGESLVISFIDGTVGVWDAHTGAQLDRIKLHGAVAQLRLDGTRLLAATDVGDHATLDLGALARDPCDLLREVWSQVPVSWRDGGPVPAAPPADHPCAAGPEVN